MANECVNCELLREQADKDMRNAKNVIYSMSEQLAKDQANIVQLRNALHLISLASQNSMSSKSECGKIARDALAESYKHE